MTETGGKHSPTQPNVSAGPGEPDLERLERAQLFRLARDAGVANTMVMTRDELVSALKVVPTGQTPKPQSDSGKAAPRDAGAGENGAAGSPRDRPTPREGVGAAAIKRTSASRT